MSRYKFIKVEPLKDDDNGEDVIRKRVLKCSWEICLVATLT